MSGKAGLDPPEGQTMKKTIVICVLAALASVAGALTQPQADALAETLLSQWGRNNGVIAVPNCGSGELLKAFWENGRLDPERQPRIHGFDDDAVALESARSLLEPSGDLNRSIYVAQFGLEKMPYADRFIDLAVWTDISDADLAGISYSEMERILTVRASAWIGGLGVSSNALQNWINAAGSRVLSSAQVVSNAQGMWAKITKVDAIPNTESWWSTAGPHNTMISYDQVARWPYLPQWNIQPIRTTGATLAPSPRTVYMNFSVCADGRMYCLYMENGNSAIASGMMIRALRLGNGQELWRRRVRNGGWSGYNLGTDRFTTKFVAPPGTGLVWFEGVAFDGETGEEVPGAPLPVFPPWDGTRAYDPPGCGGGTQNPDGRYTQDGFGFNKNSKPYRTSCGSACYVTDGFAVVPKRFCNGCSHPWGLEAPMGTFRPETWAGDAQEMAARLEAGPAFGTTDLQVQPDASDWPVYRRDNQRSGAATANVATNSVLLWQVRNNRSFVDQPSKWDPVQFDPYATAHHINAPVAAGGLVFVSSTDGTAKAVDTVTGAVVWTYRAGGAFTRSPTVANGLLYLGSADGYAYCLKAHSGELVWRFRAAPETRLVNQIGHLVSSWPICSDMVVHNGVVYFISGMLDRYGTTVWALDAHSGALVWKSDAGVLANATSREGLKHMGNLAICKNRLWVPSKFDAWFFDLATGAAEMIPYANFSAQWGNEASFDVVVRGDYIWMGQLGRAAPYMPVFGMFHGSFRSDSLPPNPSWETAESNLSGKAQHVKTDADGVPTGIANGALEAPCPVAGDRVWAGSKLYNRAAIDAKIDDAIASGSSITPWQNKWPDPLAALAGTPTVSSYVTANNGAVYIVRDDENLELQQPDGKLCFYDFATGQTTQIARIPAEYKHSLAITREGHILVGLLDGDLLCYGLPQGGAVTPPVADKPSGPVLYGDLVQLSSANPADTIRYTLDGTAPSAVNGLTYINPIVIQQSCTLRAKVINGAGSPEMAAEYVVQVDAPVFLPVENTINGTSGVFSVQCDIPGAEIYYVTSGTRKPWIEGTLYTQPFTLPQGQYTLKAFARKQGAVSSAITAKNYVIGNTASPVITPNPISSKTPVAVSITSATPSAQIWYSFDSTARSVFEEAGGFKTPDECGFIAYTAAVQVPDAVPPEMIDAFGAFKGLIYAVAKAPGISYSPVVSASCNVGKYTLNVICSEGGTAVPSGISEQAINATLKVTATPAAGYSVGPAACVREDGGNSQLLWPSSKGEYSVTLIAPVTFSIPFYADDEAAVYIINRYASHGFSCTAQSDGLIARETIPGLTYPTERLIVSKNSNVTLNWTNAAESYYRFTIYRQTRSGSTAYTNSPVVFAVPETFILFSSYSSLYNFQVDMLSVTNRIREGQTETFRFRLRNQPPVFPFELSAKFSADGIFGFSGATNWTLTAENWNNEYTVQVQGINDQLPSQGQIGAYLTFSGPHSLIFWYHQFIQRVNDDFSLALQGDGRVLTQPNHDGFYADYGGTPIPIAVTPNDREIFTGWEVLYGSATIADPEAPETTVVLGGDAVVQATFAPAVCKPVITPSSGSFVGEVEVSMTLPLYEESMLPSEQAILYTLDGSDPVWPLGGTVYTGPFMVSSNVTIKALGHAIKTSLYGHLADSDIVQVEMVRLEDDLSLDSPSGFSSSGIYGGSFTPASKTYVLSNTGAAALNWSASCAADWIAVAPASGTLASGAQVAVAVSIDVEGAQMLASGTYSDLLVFRNETSGIEQNRGASLSYLGLPAAPSGLNATAQGTSQISLTWTDNASDESGFRIERKSGGGDFVQVGARTVGVNAFSDTGLDDNTTYTYRVCAWNALGSSAYSAEASATTEDAGILIVEEHFTDLAGTGSTGVGSWSAGSITTGLTRDGLATEGGALTLGATGTVTAVYNGTGYGNSTVWFSVLAKNFVNNDRVHFFGNGTTGYGGGIAFTSSEVYPKIAYTRGGNIALPPGDTNLIVGKMVMSSTGDETVTIWVNPTDLSNESAMIATASGFSTVTKAANITASTSSKVYLNMGATTVFDEIRLGTAFFSVVPAPDQGGGDPFDDWADSYGLTGEDAAPEAMPAGDGIKNIVKYALGINPWIPGYQGRFRDGTVTVGDTTYFVLRYTRPEPVPEGVVYTVWSGSSLTSSNWTELGAEHQTSTVANGLRTVTVQDPVPMSGAASRFIRLKVTK